MDLSPIIVTWDFSEVSSFALEHAGRIANMLGKKVVLLHILKNNSNEDKVFSELKHVTNECKKKHGFEPEIIVKVGNIYTTISQTVNNLQASVVIMGTHGYYGVQKITGSRVKKVITNSNIPFVVVQAPPKQNYLKKIVIPINSNTEVKDDMLWLTNLAYLYRSEVIIFKQVSNCLKSNSKINQTSQSIINNLQSKNITYSEYTHVNNTNFYNAAADFIGKHQADIIAITTSNNNSIRKYLFDNSEQKLIANCHKIPVICINSKKESFPVE